MVGKVQTTQHVASFTSSLLFVWNDKVWGRRQRYERDKWKEKEIRDEVRTDK
jgi:hypothetical protein